MAKTVLILGSSYSGLQVLHPLFNKTLLSVKDLKVIVVSASTHMYTNTASVRAILPGQFTSEDSHLFVPLSRGFAKFPAQNFEFIVGTADAADLAGKSVRVKTESGERTLAYDFLVIATGASVSNEMPWKQESTYEQTKARIENLQKQVKEAKSIVLAGGGATGVETAGELGSEYGNAKKITLITNGPDLLTNEMAPQRRAAAGKTLNSLHVETIFNTKVTSAVKLPSGKTELTLSSGEKREVDLYLPTVGQRANTSFLPAEVLNERGQVKVDKHLQVIGAGETGTVWAIGDASDREKDSIPNAGAQGIYVAAALNDKLTGKGKSVEYASPPLAAGVTIGKSNAVAQMGNWGLPGFLIRYMKGRYLWTNKTEGLVSTGKF